MSCHMQQQRSPLMLKKQKTPALFCLNMLTTQHTPHLNQNEKPAVPAVCSNSIDIKTWKTLNQTKQFEPFK